MKPTLVGTVAIWCVLGATAALARRVEVPIEGRGHVLIVEATINQRLSGRFLVDTGATHCVISKQKAKDISLAGRNDGAKIRIQTANGLIEATMGEARRIDVGDAVAREVAVAVTPDDPVPGLDGLIGLSFLKQFKYSIDSERSILRLEN